MQSSLKPEEDYLDEDKPFRELVKKQNFCVISMLTPNAFPESKRDQYKDQKILGVKVRGVFETYENAKVRADQLQKQDKYHNIFVGEVGKWLPFNVDIATMETEEEPVYREQALNQYMKAYKDCLKEEEVEEKERKEQTLKANNAKVVTGNSGAPSSSGIGNPEIITPDMSSHSFSTNNQEINNNSNNEDNDDNDVPETVSEDTIHVSNSLKSNIDEQIQSTQNEKSKIVVELEDSKNNLKDLESKLSAINQIYADLKK